MTAPPLPEHLTFPMWEGDRKVLLGDVVRRYPALAEVDWTITEFDGSGRFPEGLSWHAFDRRVRDETYHLPGAALAAFGDGLDDLDGLVMRGALPDGRLVAVEAFDSTDWTITVSPAPPQEIRR